MGVIGVILGAIISGIINHMNGKQNYELQKKQRRIENVEKTAINFFILMQKVATHNLLMQSKSDDKIMIQKSSSEILNLNEQVKAEMQFYFDKSDYELALEICAMVNPTSEEEAQKFNKVRAEKIDYLLNSINTKVRK